jgi:hypothetical protein
MLCREIIDFFFWDPQKYIIALCGQKVEFLDVKAAGKWSNQPTLKDCHNPYTDEWNVEESVINSCSLFSSVYFIVWE